MLAMFSEKMDPWLEMKTVADAQINFSSRACT
jgi:hypothetical protein